MKTENEYDKQAADFLARFGIKMRITLSNTKPALWEPSGNHYRITLSGHNGMGYSRRLTFDFWGSVNDAQKEEDPSAYDVLACIAFGAGCPETFEDFCGEYGYEPDSIKALQTFRRCSRFASRLREFFSSHEIEALNEIH